MAALLQQVVKIMSLEFMINQLKKFNNNLKALNGIRLGIIIGFSASNFQEIIQI
jgi:hypothetical protein